MVSDIFRNSIIVAAHPDDEILWFSSLLKRVDNVLLCFLNEIANPDYGVRRRRALSQILDGNNLLSNKISCLEVNALGVSKPRSFLSPKFCQYGIELSDENGVLDRYNDQYKENYLILRDKLASVLDGYQNVFTHNPWGEYGHVEHVQVYRAVKELQKSIGYDIWFSNYCSTRTVSLTAPMFNATEIATFPTNQVIAQELMNIYKESNCWTWFDDWDWAAEETFFKDTGSGSTAVKAGVMHHINLITMPSLPSRPVFSKPTIKKRVKKIIKIFRRN